MPQSVALFLAGGEAGGDTCAWRMYGQRSAVPRLLGRQEALRADESAGRGRRRAQRQRVHACACALACAVRQAQAVLAHMQHLVPCDARQQQFCGRARAARLEQQLCARVAVAPHSMRQRPGDQYGGQRRRTQRGAGVGRARARCRFACNPGLLLY